MIFHFIVAALICAVMASGVGMLGQRKESIQLCIAAILCAACGLYFSVMYLLEVIR